MSEGSPLAYRVAELADEWTRYALVQIVFLIAGQRTLTGDRITVDQQGGVYAVEEVFEEIAARAARVERSEALVRKMRGGQPVTDPVVAGRSSSSSA